MRQSTLEAAEPGVGDKSDSRLGIAGIGDPVVMPRDGKDGTARGLGDGIVVGSWVVILSLL